MAQTVITGLRGLKQEDSCKFQGILGYRVKLFLKKKPNNKEF